MYIISAVLEKQQSRVALYDEEYKLLLTKNGACADLVKLCKDVISEGGINSGDVAYIGVAGGCCTVDPADVEKDTGIKCYTASVLGARALGEAYIANDVPHLISGVFKNRRLNLWWWIRYDSVYSGNSTQTRVAH